MKVTVILIRIKLMLAWLLVALMAAGCNFNTAQKTPVEIIKSASDDRQYQYLELPNKLRVLLISDSNAEKAAASLDVHVGSGQDPAGYQGLAHFLEHMLFLGTKKYPEAGEYQQFISAHGGSHNAYTSFEHTNYFFDVDAAYLEQTLDRFSQFFIAPLFTENYVEREKNAVHSEYMAKIKADQRKSLDVFKTVINQNHPFAKFSVGNLDTLGVNDGENLTEQLIRFYNKHYSASLMTLVVSGREPLAELSAMVVERFSAVANNHAKVIKINQPLFEPGQLPLMLEIKPEKQQRTLSIGFPTADVTDHFRQKPLHYLGNIIGHEGRGSLLSYLKQQGWAEGLSAGAGLSYAGGASFNISIKLTPVGVEHVDEIITAVFQALNRIGESADQRRLFEEQRALAAQTFRYQEKSAPINYAMALATDLHYYPPADVLRGTYLMEQFDRELIQRFLSYLRPDNSIITLSEPGVKVDQTSHFYATEYRVYSPQAERLSRWQSAGTNADIKMPAPNVFIAEDLAIKSVGAGSTDNDEASPQLLSSDNGVRLWHKRDLTFKQPKGSLLFSLRSPIASDSAEHRALLDLTSSVIADELNELSYPATLAGLGYSLKSHSRGLSIKITGFNDKQPQLLAEILNVLKDPVFDSRRFDNIKQEHIRRLENVGKQQPYRRAMTELSKMLYRNSWSDQQMLAAYQGINLQQLRAFKQQLLASGEIDLLVHGNFLRQDAERYARMINSVLLDRHQPSPAVEVAKLPFGNQGRKVDSDYSDAVVLLYIQAADTDKKRRAAMGITAQLMRADFYTRLRTEKQLGYIVTAGAYPVRDVPGMFFLVQSPVAGPGLLQQEIEGYLQRQVDVAASLTAEQFDRHRKAVLLRLAESPKNLWEQSERYWQDIAHNYYDFNFKQQLITAMESLTLTEWQQYFQQDMAGANRRMLWLYSAGQFASQPALKTKEIDNVPVFKSAQGYYKFP